MKPGNAQEGLRQAMSWLHTWTGLVLGWVLFAMFLTGTLAFFRPEITAWMQPEARPAMVEPARALDTAVDYLQRHGPDSPRWFVSLPGEREPAMRLAWQAARPQPGQRRFSIVYLDPASGREIAARETRGGDFLYRFHFELGIGYPWGRWLAGVAAMFMLVAIVSGVITHKKIFTDFFTFRPGKGQRSWLDGHNALSVLGLPFHFMITFSGLLLLMAMLLPAGILAAYDSERAFFDEAFPAFRMPEASGRSAPLAPLAPMLADARMHWQGGSAGRVTVSRPNDANALVSFTRDEGDRISYGRGSPVRVYDGATGRARSQSQDPGGATLVAGTVVGLHLGYFAHPLLRWLYFLVGLAGTAMVGSGLLLWVAKRRQKHAKAAQPPFSLRLVESLNVGSIAGLCVAVGAYFWANRLLPAGLAGRADWEVRAFFAAWALAFAHAGFAGRRGWGAQWAAAAVLLGGVPLLNAATSDRHLGHSLAQGDWVMAGFDLAALACGLLFAWLAVKALRARRQAAHAAQAAQAVQAAAQAARAARATQAGLPEGATEAGRP